MSRRARLRRRGGAAIVAALAIALCVSGCGLSAKHEAEKVAKREAQLREFRDRAHAWGADIIAQIPEDEPHSMTDDAGGSRKTSAYYEEWPKYYVWDRIVNLHLDGPRSSTQIADDLEPWLRAEGWVRSTAAEFPPTENRFMRDYYRDGYHLVVDAHTDEPPRHQSIGFMIVTPKTE